MEIAIRITIHNLQNAVGLVGEKPSKCWTVSRRTMNGEEFSNYLNTC